MAYTYDAIFAVDPNSPSNVARNASILIFDPNDATKTPVTLTDITGSPITNPITVNQHGFGPAIKHATLDRLAWEGAGMSGVFTSYEGMKEEAVAARVAAQTAATEAGQAATADLAARIAAGEFKGDKGNDGSNVLPTDTAIKNAITTPGTQTEAALSATYALKSEAGGKAAFVLAPWRQKFAESPAAAKIALIGDSTRDSAAAGLLFHNSIKFHIAQGRLLEGMTPANVLNHAFNGATVQFITNTANMAALTAAAPDLVEVSMGINNIRATALTTDQMETILAAGIEAIRAAVPGVPIIGTIPNSFLTTDVGGAGSVVPNGDAQAKSTILRAAWLRMMDRWPDVLVRDTQETIFGTVSPATSPFMGDQLHPSTAGTDASAAELAAMIGYVKPYVQALAVAARAAAPYTPWTVYGREVEDPARYILIASGEYATQGTNFVRFKYPPGRKANIRPLDILELPDGTSISLKGGFNTNANGAYTDLTLASGETVPTNTTTKGDVKVWRRRFSGDSVFNDAAADTMITYRRVGRIHTGGAGFLRVTETTLGETLPGTAVSSSLWNTTTVAGDKLYIEGYGSNPITLAGGGSSNQGWELSTAGDWSTYVGRLVMITSTSHT
jgi:lysophospholipase L1-like esterase